MVHFSTGLLAAISFDDSALDLGRTHNQPDDRPGAENA
jgi:hypothetical protein